MERDIHSVCWCLQSRGALLDAKVLVWAARIVAGSQDEASVGLASVASADHR